MARYLWPDQCNVIYYDSVYMGTHIEENVHQYSHILDYNK